MGQWPAAETRLRSQPALQASPDMSLGERWRWSAAFGSLSATLLSLSINVERFIPPGLIVCAALGERCINVMKCRAAFLVSFFFFVLVSKWLWPA